MWALLFIGTTGHTEEVPVNILNFVTAQTTMQFDTYQDKTGGVNKILNIREPAQIADQVTIRLNRDTLYSFMVIDISEGATVTLPDANGRYMSMMVVNEQAKSAKPFTMANYDMASYKSTLNSLLELGSNVPNSKGWFGSKADTTPIAHLIGAADS
jgi:hypothetical protein